MARQVKRRNSDGAGIAKTSSKAEARPNRAAGKHGRLQDLPNMPLDIVVEILSLLQPLDLLHLARTSKAFRAVLADRRNAFLWKKARQNIDGLPECPPGVSEPAYANFIFCTTCNDCGKPNSQHIYWDRMIRYCRKCETKDHKWTSERWVSGEASIDRLFIAVKFEREIRGVLARDFMRMRSKDPIQNQRFLDQPWRKFGYCVESEFLRMDNLLSSMCIEERTGYVAAQVHRIREWREKWVPDISRWFQSQEDARKAEVKNNRHTRHIEVCKKLLALGWRDEFLAMSTKTWVKFENLPIIHQPKTLTDRAWARICPAVLEHLEGVKQERLFKERQARLEARFKAFDDALTKLYSYHPGLPTELDIALGVPRLRDVIDGAEVDVGAKSFDFMQEAIPPFIAGWKNRLDSHLAALVVQDLETVDHSVDPLELAVACRFTCKACNNVASHAQTHRCKAVCPTVDQSDVYAAAAVKHLSPHHWAPVNFESNVHKLSPIIRLCGQDPATATVEDMDNLPVRLACESCNPDTGLMVMTWFTSFSHLLSSHDDFDIALADLRVVPGDQATAAKGLEPVYLKRSFARASDSSAWWCCGRCPQKTAVKSTGRRAIMHHLLLKHNVEAMQRDMDFWHEDESVRVRQPRDAQVYLLRGCHMDAVLSLPDELQEAFRVGYAKLYDLP